MKNKKSIYDPILEQLLLLIAYINILEKRPESESIEEIIGLNEQIGLCRWRCDQYLNVIMKRENDGNQRI